LNTYTFHINLYDLAFLGTIFLGLGLALQLGFTKRNDRAANRFLGLALLTVVFWLIWVTCRNIRLGTYLPRWSWLPMQFSLGLGPLMFFYVRKITRPEYKLRWRDLWHFIPLLLRQGILVMEIRESIRTGVATYDTLIFKQSGPVLQLLIPISVLSYLFWSHRLIAGYYQTLKFIGGDRYRYEMRWLHRLLAGFGLLCLLWIFYTAVDYFYYDFQLGLHAYYPLYLLVAVMMLWIGAVAFLRPGAGLPGREPLLSNLSASGAWRQKGIWLKKAMKANLYYQDAELNLRSLAETLDIHPNELSRIINTAFGKNFNDFINEYRIREVTRKMQDPAYDRLTLLGIALGAGFNSKSTFNRVFREMTGKSPAEYMSVLKKERPTYTLRPYSRSNAIISSHETTPMWSYEKLNPRYMFKNYLKVAWRSLIKNKAHAFINILGLSVGLTFSLLILLWVQNELSVDGFHQNDKQLYTVYERQYIDNQVQGVYYTPSLLSDELKKRIPEVQYAANAMYDFQSSFNVGDKKLTFNGGAAGSDYFKMFSFPLLEGDIQTALNSPVCIAISQKMAGTFFGSPHAAIGKTLRYENKQDFKITAVFRDVPDNAQQKFDFLINWDAFLQNAPFLKNWGVSAPLCYVTLRADANATNTEKKLTHFLDDLVPYQKKGSYSLELGLQRFDQVYLHNHFTNGRIDGGRIEYVELFSIVAIFILLIACINFMNLTTARSVKRAKEIGVRKVIGAMRFSLIKQFICESLLLTTFSVVVSLVLVIVLLPFFNSITQKHIELPFAEYTFWLKVVFIILVTGLVSGSYPALFLSSFNPIQVLKGNIRLGKGVLTFRKGLVVFQFVLSIILIVSTVIVSRQVRYIQSKNLGFDRENLVYLPLKGNIAGQYSVFKSEVNTMPGVESISRIAENPNNIITNTVGVNWKGKDPNLHVQFAFVAVGYDFVHTMHLQLAQGRDYSKSFPSDSAGYLINEAALLKIGYKDPIGKPLTMWGNTGPIIGILKDFHYTSLHEPIKPLIVRFDEHERRATALVRTQPGKTRDALATLKTLWERLNPNFPFEYTFSDEEYQKMYQNEQVVGKLANVFAFLSVFISSLGLLGLAMFTAEQRVKELGIRKVMGATVISLFGLLAYEFLGLVIVALLIASPLAWLAMHRWLQGYAYHIQIEWWIFLVAGFAAVLISFITVSFQAARAALINPVRSLKSE